MSNKEFWKNYQEQAWTTCMPSCQNWEYLTLGLQSEIGELCGKLKKKIRGDYDDCPEKFVEDMKAETSDCLWYHFGIMTLKKTTFSDKIFSMLFDENEVFENIYHWIVELPAYSSNFIRNFNYWKKEEGITFGELILILSMIAITLGFTLEEAATYNLEKLAKRYKTDKIMGSGDYR